MRCEEHWSTDDEALDERDRRDLVPLVVAVHADHERFGADDLRVGYDA